MSKPDASRRSRVTTVLLAATILIGGANIAAVAATGFSLGHRNVAAKTTTFVNHGSGPVIALKGRRSAPPIKLNSRKKVRHLNADRLDGRNAASLANTNLTYRLTTTGNAQTVNYTFPGLPPGIFQVSYYVNRTLKASGQAAPRLACAIAPTSADKGQLTTLSPAGTHATQSAVGVLRVDGSATLSCQVQNGTLVSSNPDAASAVNFLKVDRSAYGIAGRAAAAR